MSASSRKWRCLFIAFEVGVFVPFIIFSGFIHFPGTKEETGFVAWQYVAAALWWAAWLFLLIVSPFFLRSLRGVALAGWIISFGILLFAALFPRL